LDRGADESAEKRFMGSLLPRSLLGKLHERNSLVEAVHPNAFDNVYCALISIPFGGQADLFLPQALPPTL
jgi:hypothetical protein